jgi:hypothetical protein
MKKGSIIECKREGFASFILGGILKRLEPAWDGWGWHLGIAWEKGVAGWYVLESTGKGVQLSFYSNKYLQENTRCYDWLGVEPPQDKLDRFLKRYIGKDYDIAIYFWTALAVIIRHYFNRPIPKLLDNRFSCWELVGEFCAEMGKPIVSKYDVIIISDVIRALMGWLLNQCS